MKTKTLAITFLLVFLSSTALIAGSQPKMDIVDTAVSAGSFNTLVAAVQAAGLAETLKGEGPFTVFAPTDDAFFTVFAPTDDAFAKLPAGTLDDLLKPENKDKLAGILTYHVVSGKVMAKDVMTMKEAKTVNGQSVMVGMEADTVMIDNAKVVTADIECTNGVIHVIDTVILPK
jgi:uncharacterized surface protein with fasciclin (FAS1) repeats